jgi:hypothetical protein
MNIEPDNYLGNSYNDYREQIFSLALADPKVYFSQKRKITQDPKRDAIQNLYETISKALLEGKTRTGNSIYNATNNNAGIDFGTLKPDYPKQKVNQLCLDASATLDSILNEVVDIIMPDKFNEVLETKLNKVGKGTLV